MAFYIKVTKEVADRLHLTDIRNRTADGNVLLWQADVARFPGDTVFDRAKEAGGICLTPPGSERRDRRYGPSRRSIHTCLLGGGQHRKLRRHG